MTTSKKQMKKKFIAIVVIVAAALLILALLPTQGVTELAGEEKAAVLAYAEPAVENILASFNSGDYAGISRDFDEQMKNAFTEEVFLQNHEMIISKIGLYLSRGEARVLKQGPYLAVLHTAEFENEPEVTVRTVFVDYSGQPLVSGLWFTSPKLRE